MMWDATLFTIPARLKLQFAQDEGDEYNYQDDDDDEHVGADENDFDEVVNGRRRSQRTAMKNANGKRASDAYGEWRGERRSTRLAGEYDEDDGDRKRARTEERSASSAPSDSLAYAASEAEGATLKENGAASVKSHEVAIEQMPGKKKSKFWFYAVEPTAGVNSTTDRPNGAHPSLNDVEDKGQINGQGEKAITVQNGIHNGERADTPSALFSAEEKAWFQVTGFLRLIGLLGNLYLIHMSRDFSHRTSDRLL